MAHIDSVAHYAAPRNLAYQKLVYVVTTKVRETETVSGRFCFQRVLLVSPALFDRRSETLFISGSRAGFGPA